MTDSNQTTFPNGNGLGNGAGQISAPGFDLTHNGQTDVFVAKYSPDGTLFVYVTYLGGSQGDGGNSLGIALDAPETPTSTATPTPGLGRPCSSPARSVRT